MLKGIPEIQQALDSGNEQQRLQALAETLQYGQQGFDFLMEYSLRRDTSEKLKQSAYWIIHGYNPYLISSEKEPKTCPTDTITSLAISPDNSLLVGGSWKKIWIWYLQTGEIFQSIEAHSHWVLSIAISPDGSKVVSGSADKTIKIWDLKTGKLIGTLTGHSSWVNAVIISSDGKKIVSGSADKTIKIWNLSTGSLDRTIKKEKELDAILTLAISPDGQVIASGSTNHKIIFWELRSGNLIRIIDSHEDWIQTVFITPDCKTVISASRDGSIKFWRSKSDSENESFDSNLLLIRSFIDTAATLICISVNVYIGVIIPFFRLIYNRFTSTKLPVQSLECTIDYKYHQAIKSLTCSISENKIALGFSQSIEVSYLKNKEQIYTVSTNCNFITSVAISFDGKFLVSAGKDWVIIWDLQSGKPLYSPQGCSYRKLSKIIINEISQKVFCGQSQQFTIQGLDQNNREINLEDKDVKWEATGGTIEQGLFIAGQREGNFQVKARVEIFEESVPITIIEPPKVTDLIVTPTTVKLEFGQIQQFVGQVLDQRRNKMIQETVCWTTKGGGTIDQHGNFTAGCSTGKFEIIASVGSIQRFIPISIVEPPKLKDLILTSSIPHLEFGQHFQFNVKGVDQYGNDIKLEKVTWSATSGNIDNNGIFEASYREEIVIIRATIGEISTYTEIEVREPSQLTKIQIFPLSVTLKPGQCCQFSLVAFNQRDEEIPVKDIDWSATNGIITQTGSFCTQDDQKGYCEVTATVGHLSATVAVFVTSVLKYIIISPKEVELRPEEKYTFTLTGFDQKGDRLDIKNIQWTTTRGGFITGDGIFQGDYQHREVIITATVGEIRATAKVILLSVLRRLEIYPCFVYLKPSEKQAFTVKGFDQFNEEIEPSQISWETTGGKIDQNGVLTVVHQDQGYIQVTASSISVSKYSKNVRTFLLYTGIFTRLISWFISYEMLLKDVFDLDLEPAEASEQLDDTADPKAQLEADTVVTQDTAIIVQTEQGQNLEVSRGTEVNTAGDRNVLSFDTALQGWVFQKIRKLIGPFLLSVSRFCLNEAIANLSASADVFVLTVEYNPYKYLECFHILYGHSSCIASLAITPDSQKLISTSTDDTIKIWDINKGDELHSLENHSSGVDCAAITPDGQKLVSGGRDSTIKIWDLNNNELINSLNDTDDLFLLLRITSDGQKLISLGRSNIIKIWDLKNQELLKTLEFAYHSFWWCHCISITPDNKKIIVGGNIIKVYDLETGQLKLIIGRDLGSIRALAITPDGQKLISSSYDGDGEKIIIWDLTTKGTPILLTLQSFAKRVYALTVTPDGQRIISTGYGINSDSDTKLKSEETTYIEIWNLNTGERLHFIEEYASDKNFFFICCLAITPDGKQIISGYTDGTIKIWGVPNLDE